jgi:hypothetical protein
LVEVQRNKIMAGMMTGQAVPPRASSQEDEERRMMKIMNQAVSPRASSSEEDEERRMMQMMELMQQRRAPNAAIAMTPQAQQQMQNFQAGRQQAAQPLQSVSGGSGTAKPEAPGLLSRLGRAGLDRLQDPESRARIAMALNSMRLQPDQGLARSLQGRAEGIQERRQQASQANRTAAFLRAEGSENLADLIHQQPDLAAFALKQHYEIKTRQPTTLEQKIATLQAAYPNKTPQEIAQLASGIQNFDIKPGKEVNKMFGSDLPEGRLYKVNSVTGEVTGIEGAPDTPSDTSLIKEYRFAKDNEGFKGSFEEFMRIRYPASDPASKPLSQGESNATGFYSRVLESHRLLLQPTDQGLLEEQGTSFSNAMLEKDPTGLARYAMADEYKRYEQAKRDFINANLRRESGAAIQPSEFDSAEKQYFPVPGDSPAVIAQKRRNRETVINALRVASGAGADRLGISASVVGNTVVFPSGRSVVAKDVQTAIAMADEFNRGQKQ